MRRQKDCNPGRYRRPSRAPAQRQLSGSDRAKTGDGELPPGGGGGLDNDQPLHPPGRYDGEPPALVDSWSFRYFAANFGQAAVSVTDRLVLSDGRWARMSGLALPRANRRGSTGRDNRMLVKRILQSVRLARRGEICLRHPRLEQRLPAFQPVEHEGRVATPRRGDARRPELRAPDRRFHHRACLQHASGAKEAIKIRLSGASAAA